MIQELLSDKYVDINNPELGIKEDWQHLQFHKTYNGQIVINDALLNVRFLDATLSIEVLDECQKFTLEIGVEYERNDLPEKYEWIRQTCKVEKGGIVQNWSALTCPFEIIVKPKNN